MQLIDVLAGQWYAVTVKAFPSSFVPFNVACWWPTQQTADGLIGILPGGRCDYTPNSVTEGDSFVWAAQDGFVRDPPNQGKPGVEEVKESASVSKILTHFDAKALTRAHAQMCSASNGELP